MKLKNYLVVGGSSGIGLSVTKKLIGDGNLVIVASSNEKKLCKVKEDLGSQVLTVQCNLENLGEIENIFNFVKDENIVLDGMVYCAGISPLCLLKDNTSELMEKVYHINLFSFIECARHYYDESISKEGSAIVAIASITAHTSGYRQILYGSSKAAMVSACKLMAKELLNRKIRINCISPGVSATDMLVGLYENVNDMDGKIRKNQPLGIIQPESIAEIVKTLLSPTGQYITGTEIIYDGGFLLG